MKTAFLISGFNMNQCAADPKYAPLREAVAAQDYNVVPVPFTWNHKTIEQYVELFVDFYEKNKGDYNVVIGNSYGAMVAFLSAPKVRPNRLLLCSLSPFFKEDASKTTLEFRLAWFGKRREAAMQSLSAKETAKLLNQTNIDVTLLYGEQEKEMYPHLVERVKDTARDLKAAQLVEVAGAPHSSRDPAYIKGIAAVLAH